MFPWPPPFSALHPGMLNTCDTTRLPGRNSAFNLVPKSFMMGCKPYTATTSTLSSGTVHKSRIANDVVFQYIGAWTNLRPAAKAWRTGLISYPMLVANRFCRAAWKTNRPSPLPRSQKVSGAGAGSAGAGSPASPPARFRFSSRERRAGLDRIRSHMASDERAKVGRYGAPLRRRTGGRLRRRPRLATRPRARPALTAGCRGADVMTSSSSEPSGRDCWRLPLVDVRLVLLADSRSSSPSADSSSFSSLLAFGS
mmetsp:Transcript_10560/g.29688  ORF Transcript_10560/g.29688 Transcript_10560/m.29688 type:complete len:254 (+) Transcript_10560:169-930(+)